MATPEESNKSEKKPETKPPMKGLMDYSDDDDDDNDDGGASSDDDKLFANGEDDGNSQPSSQGKSSTSGKKKKKKKKKKKLSSKASTSSKKRKGPKSKSSFMEDEAEESDDGDGSSDESEDEDENDYEADGFVVRSDEEPEESSDGDSSSDEDSDDGKNKLSRLRRKRDDLSDLDDEVNDLLGGDVKKAKHEDDDEGQEEQEDDNVDDDNDSDSGSSLDDFIDDGDNGKRKKNRRNKHKRRGDGLTDEQAQQFHTLFGYDANFFEEPKEQDGEDEFMAEENEKLRQRRKEAEAAMHGRYEPDMLKGEYLTPLDMMIKRTDVPERIQLQHVGMVGEERYLAGEIDVLVDPSDEEAMALQARWVVVNLEKYVKRKIDLGIAGEAFNLNRSNPFDDRNALAGHVQKALEMFQRYQLEVPYVCTYAAEDVGMLPEQYLWAVYDLGVKYREFVSRVRAVRTFIEKYIPEDIHDETGLGPLYFEFTQYANVTTGETETKDGDENNNATTETKEENSTDDAVTSTKQSENGGEAVESKSSLETPSTEVAAGGDPVPTNSEGTAVAPEATKTSSTPKVSTRAKLLALLDVFMTTELCDEQVVQELQEFLRVKYSKQVAEVDEVDEEVKRANEEHFGDENDENEPAEKVKKMKRPSMKKTAGSKLKISSSNPLSRAVGDSTHLGANVENQRRVYPGKPDPLAPPEEMALELLGSDLDSEEKVLTAVQESLAREIALEHRIRSLLRNVFRQSGKVNTTPTIKGRKEVADDSTHSAYEYISLSQKPYSAFLQAPQRNYDTGLMGTDYRDQILYILRAQRSGLLDVSINSAELQSRILSLLLPFFLSEQYQGFTVNDAPAVLPPWDRLRYDTLVRCTKNYLVPWCQREMINELRKMATEYVLSECTLSLRSRIEVAPFSLPVDETENLLRVPPEKIHAVGVVLTVDRKEHGYVVALDTSGTVLDHRQLPPMQGRVWQEVLDRFVDEFAPHLVVLSSSVGMRVRQAKAHLDKACAAKVAEWNNLRRTQLGEDDDNTCPYFYTAVVDDQVANAYASSPRAEKELKNMDMNLRKAISVARYMQNPLAELATLFTDVSNGLQRASESNLLAVHMHRSQRLIPATMLLSNLERAFVGVTAITGVDLNHITKNDHASSILQFVPGLGPRKASSLLQTLRRVGGWVYTREDLRERLAKASGVEAEDDQVGCVFRNAAGFLQCVERNSMEDDYLENTFGVLDGTRIHPDDFQIACIIAWMAKHGMGTTKTPPDFLYDEGRLPQAYEKCIQAVMDSAYDAFERKKETSSDWFKDWMRTIHNDAFQRGIVHVDFDDHIRETGWWLDDLVKKNIPNIRDLIEGIENSFVGGKKSAQILFCIDELRFPLLEKRMSYRPPDADTYFELLTGDSIMSLREGMVVTVIMKNVDDRWIQAQIDGLRCSIHQNDISDERVDFRDEHELKRYVRDNLKWSRGQPIRGVIKSLDRGRFLVNLSAKPSDVKAASTRVADPYWVDPRSLPGSRGVSNSTKKDDAPPPFRTRPIVHDSFKNIGWQEAEQELATKDIGDLIIRPSSKGLLKLGVSVKCGNNPSWVQHVNVTEKGKKSTDPTLASTLFLDNDTFEDLDELIARYFTPIAEFLRDLFEHRSYRVGNIQQVEQSLKAEKRAQPSRVPYCICRNEKMPGTFYLMYLPGQNTVQREKVGVSPRGYKLGQSVHTSVDKLIGWFKKNVGQLQAARMQAHRGSHRGSGNQGYSRGYGGGRHDGYHGGDRHHDRDNYGSRGGYDDRYRREPPRYDNRGGGGYSRY